MTDITPRQTRTKPDSARRIPAFAVNVLRFTITIITPFLLAVGSARLVMNPGFLAFEYQRAGFPEDFYGFSTEDRLEYGPYGVLYIINNEPMSYLAELELPGELCYLPQRTPCPAFNEFELSHMHDVQVVAQMLFMAGLWGAVLAAAAGAVLWRFVSIEALRLALFQGSVLTIGLIIAIILLAVTAWDVFFTGFHGIFFEDGTWQFYYSDTLIRLYPEQFWFDASLLVGLLTTAGALVILVTALKLRSRTG